MSDAANKPAAIQRVSSAVFSRIRRIEIVIAAVVTLAGLYVYGAVAGRIPGGALFTFVQNVELRSLDALFRSRGPRPPDPRIVIIGIDERTLRKVGAWPIPRSAYAQLVDKLHEDGAKSVAF